MRTFGLVLLFILIAITGLFMIATLASPHDMSLMSRFIPVILISMLSIVIAYASVFLIIPFAIWLGTQSARELKNNGSETYGIIHKAWYSRQKSKADVWSIQAKYLVNNKLYYTSTKQNPNKTLFVGDTVTIIYSKSTPQMSEILELIQEY